MRECKECNKNLGILSGYCHPIMGRDHLLCSECFDKVSESVEKWGTFVLSNPDVIDSLDIDREKLINNFESTVKSIMKTYDRISNNQQVREYPKNKPEYTIFRDNKQELFPENIPQHM